MISAAAAALPQLALISAIDAPTCPTESEIAPPTIGIKLPAANCTVFMTAESAASPIFIRMASTKESTVIDAVQINAAAFRTNTASAPGALCPVTQETAVSANTALTAGSTMYEKMFSASAVSIAKPLWVSAASVTLPEAR